MHPALMLLMSTEPEFVLNIPSSVNSPKLRTLAVAAGWNTTAPVRVNITAPYVGGLRLASTDSFPGGIRIDIAAGSNVVGIGAGGTAFKVQQPVVVDNHGGMLGGGGLGGRGGYAMYGSVSAAGGTGGYGQGMSGSGTTIEGPYQGQAGQTVTDGGFPPGYTLSGGRGGDGGQLGQKGFNGAAGSTNGGPGTAYPGEEGNPPGLAVDGYSYVTWINQGVLKGGVAG